jgi:hypothetical protein
LVVAAITHRARSVCPAGARPSRGSDNQPSRLSNQLNVLRKPSLIEQCFGHTNATEIADLDDAGLCRHVITV